MGLKRKPSPPRHAPQPLGPTLHPVSSGEEVLKAEAMRVVGGTRAREQEKAWVLFSTPPLN